VPFSATRDLWLILKARDEGSRALRSFSRDIRMVGDSVQMANLQAARSALSNQLATQKLSGASQQQLLATQNQISATDQQIAQMKLSRAEMEEQRFSSQRLSAVLGGVAGVFTTLGTAAVAAGTFASIGLKSLIDSAVAYEKQAALTATQVDNFRYSLQQIEDVGIRVAKAVGVPFEQIQPALFDIFSSMEVSIDQAESLLETFSKAAVAGQVDIQAASRATIGILNAFQLPLDDVNHLMDVQFQLVQEGIGSYEEWTQRIGLVTPSAVRAGQSVEMMSAALAASTRMGISAARSGTAVARALDAFSNPAAIEGMHELGVEALDADGNFRPLIDVLFDFRKQLEGLPEAEKIKKILEVFKGAGGTIEARRFLQNMLVTPGNLELFQSILKEMETSSGSFEEAYAIMADTTATKTQSMQNAWETLKVKAGQVLQPTFEKVIGFLQKMFDIFNGLSPEQQSFIVKLIAFGVALMTVGGILAIIIGTITAFAAAVAVAGTGLLVVLGVVALITAAFVAFAAGVYIAWQKSQTFRDMVQDVGQKVSDFYHNTLVPIGQEIAKTWNEKVLPPLQQLWALIQEKVLPILKEVAQHITEKMQGTFIEWGNKIKDFVIWAMERLGQIIKEDIIPAIQFLTKYYQDHKEAIDNIIDALIFLLKWLGIIVGFIVGVLIVVFVGPVVAAFLAVVGVIMIVIDTIVRLIEGFKDLWKKVQEIADGLHYFFNPATMAAIAGQWVQGFINGITNKFQEVKNIVQNLGGSTVSWFKSVLGIASPSKVFMKIGKQSMEGYIMGMRSMSPAINAQVMNATGGITTAAGIGASGNGTPVNQTINVETQEIDPRKHAAELGWLLGGRR
jgi:TP901 family phage tail tape measure protein